MQILYWHLRRPRRSSFGFGGQVHSPPLLQRPTTSLTIDTFPHPLIEEEAEDDEEMDMQDIMELDHEGTVYLLNVDHLIRDSDHGHQVLNINNLEAPGPCITQIGGINVLQNGYPHQELQNGQIDYEDTSGQYTANGNNNKRKGTDYDPSSGDEDDENYVDENGCGDFVIQRHSPQPQVVTKRPKLIVNLYEKERGYEFGCKLTEDESEKIELSHMIPYTEDMLLKSIDRCEIPQQLLGAKQDCQWNHGHIIAQIRDFRFDSQQGYSSSSSSNSHRQISSQRSPIKNNNRPLNPIPTVREVILEPTTQSILTDFDRLIDKSIKDRNKWKDRGTRGYGYHDEADGDDSEYEFEVDLPSSLRQHADEFTYDQKLELEKEFVNRSSEALCLDPSPVVGLLKNRSQHGALQLNEQKSTGNQGKSRFDTVDVEESEFKPNSSLLAFHGFVQGIKDRLGSIKDLEPLKLPAMACVDYPVLENPRSQDEISKMGQAPEPSTLRALDRDNFVKKIEEYTLETERRKRPHTTKLSIYQRNGMDSYFGELEMESFLDGPNNVKPGGNATKPGDPATATTKCQFELGSSRSVALYVKQFSDIFTEDGRRPCKITYQKVGQPQPQVLYTNAYKVSQAGSAGSSVASPGSSGGNTNASVTPASNSTQSQSPNHVAQTPSIPTQPPVQIVHPQPRSVQQQTGTIDTVTVQTSNSSQNSNQTVASVTSSVNFNVNVNSGGGMTPQQQILTRPQIVSVNLQPQQQQSVNSNVQSQGVRPMVTQQQIIQQRLMRMKQQQAQQQQQPTTALAKLLLTNIQTTSTGSRPITVAVQPQPQTPHKINNNVAESQQHVTVNPSTLMITSPSAQQAIQPSNVNVNVNTAPNLSVNLNAITLDGLLSRNSNSLGNASGGNHNHNIGTTNLRLASSGAGNVPGAVNILRVNSGGGLSTGGQSLQRQLTMSNMTAGNVSILQTSQPQQRIYINANGGQSIGSVTLTGGNSDVEEISVPDLNSLLNSGTGSTVHIGGQTQSMNNSGLAQMASQTPNVDTHNLNLNLNVNLNSGTVVNTGDSSHSQLQASSQGSAPFLVFISPLRSMPGGGRQITSLPSVVSSASPSTLSLNLGSLQQSQSHMMSHSNMNNIVTSLASSGNVISVPALSNNCAVSSQNVSSTGEVVDGVDSIFNALSEAIGPELGQKLDGLGGNTVMIGNTPYTVSVSSGDLNSSQVSPSIVSSGSKKDGSLITLSDLLGSPTASSNPGLSLSSLILNSAGGTQSIMVSSPQSSVSSTSSMVSSTPRLSALLAGTPSADSSLTRIPAGSPLASPTSITDSSTTGGTLLDRLAASLSHNNNQPQQQRAGGSGLNPIATATPSVVLEHPVLAATLTGQQPSRGVSAYRQIAPAPTSSSTSMNRKH